MSQGGRAFVEDCGFYPVLPAFIANDAALHSYRGGGRDGAAVIDFKMSRHGCETASANGLAHGFVEQSCDDSSVQKARMPFKSVGNARGAYDGSILRKEEFELKSIRIGLAAPEAAVLSGMSQRRQIIEVRLHAAGT